jgi:hypothetical protein
VRDCLGNATADNLPLAQEIVSLPGQIRGYEDIKLANVREVKQLAAEKLSALKDKLGQVC